MRKDMPQDVRTNMPKDPQGIDLRAAAGDFVAGDLSDEDQQLFQAECAKDDDLQADCRFWEGLRDDLRCHGRDPAARLPVQAWHRPYAAA